MKNSFMLKCKICNKEEEIFGISYEYYMLYHFVPNEVDEICESCGNESLVPVNPMKIEHSEHSDVKQCEYCGTKYCENCGAKLRENAII